MGKRIKTYKRLLQQYKLLGFRTPWQILMTADIIEETIKLDLVHLLEKALSGPVKPMITSCAIRVLYQKNIEGGNADPILKQVIERAKSFERCRCGHLMDADPLPEMECVLSQVNVKEGGNKRKYCVATQNTAIRQKLRAIPAVPLIYCNRSVVILEPLSAATSILRRREETVKYRGGIISRSRPGKRKRGDDGSDDDNDDDDNDDDDEHLADEADEGDQDSESIAADAGAVSSKQEEEKKKKKQRGPKGANPLSMKKSKKKVETGQRAKKPASLPQPGDSADQTKAKRKRRKKNKSGGEGEGDGPAAESTVAIGAAAAVTTEA